MKRKNVLRVLVPVIALFLCGVVVLMERMGITYEYTAKEEAVLAYSNPLPEDKLCLLLTSEEEVSKIYEDMTKTVLDGMKVGYDCKGVDTDFNTESLSGYQTVIVMFQEWSRFGNSLPKVMKWVQEGGMLLTTVTPQADGNFRAVSSKLGIMTIGEEYPPVTGFRMKNDCMAGAPEDTVFRYDLGEGEEFRTSLEVELDSKCTVYMESEDGAVPLIWTRDYGEGRIAVLNEVISDKYQRGFLCLAYSLLPDVTVYPVIDASAFYLDDFPSPVPEGDGTYISRDYGVDIAAFYSNIWWPDVLEWEDTYQIKHTGLIIEQYSDETKAPFERNEASTQFLTYGNMLLNNGGELGFHGYNHMPLCLAGEDDAYQYGSYKLWNTAEDMEASITELWKFSEELFPENEFRVYVPPSNILTEAGERALRSACPDISIIAGTYLRDADGIALEQEFCEGEDGVIYTPRITSGCMIDDYQKIVALSELNFQYVQSHFMHPDDVLDAERGARKGWEYMKQSFETYLDWIYTSVPHIRNVTGSGMGTAVQQYDRLSVQREREEDALFIRLGGFSGEASLMLRVNEGSITGARGCTYEKITGNLYAVRASEPEIRIYLGEAE